MLVVVPSWSFPSPGVVLCDGVDVPGRDELVGGCGSSLVGDEGEVDSSSPSVGGTVVVLVGGVGCPVREVRGTGSASPISCRNWAGGGSRPACWISLAGEVDGVTGTSTTMTRFGAARSCSFRTMAMIAPNRTPANAEIVSAIALVT
ncbi:MAG TPA: hypothetical protein VIL00_17785 [Pseudonocardiaceae bacterium]